MSTKNQKSSPANDPADSATLLLLAAQKLFAEKGFDGVTVRGIADEAGVHFGLVRYHYGSKEGIYRACIQKYGQARLLSAKRFLETPTSKEDFILKLRYAIEDVLEIQLENPELTRLVLREAEAQNSIADDVLGDTLVQMAKCFIVFFLEAGQAGYLRHDADPLFITNTLQGTINHFIRTDAIRSRHFNTSLKDADTKKNLVNQLHNFVLHGILSGT